MRVNKETDVLPPCPGDGPIGQKKLLSPKLTLKTITVKYIKCKYIVIQRFKRDDCIFLDNYLRLLVKRSSHLL